MQILLFSIVIAQHGKSQYFAAYKKAPAKCRGERKWSNNSLVPNFYS